MTTDNQPYEQHSTDVCSVHHGTEIACKAPSGAAWARSAHGASGPLRLAARGLQAASSVAVVTRCLRAGQGPRRGRAARPHRPLARYRSNRHPASTATPRGRRLGACPMWLRTCITRSRWLIWLPGVCWRAPSALRGSAPTRRSIARRWRCGWCGSLMARIRRRFFGRVSAMWTPTVSMGRSSSGWRNSESPQDAVTERTSARIAACPAPRWRRSCRGLTRRPPCRRRRMGVPGSEPGVALAG